MKKVVSDRGTAQKRRGEAKEIECSQVKQAVKLAEWFRAAYPNLQPYKAKTIKNRLAAKFRSAMSPSAPKAP